MNEHGELLSDDIIEALKLDGRMTPAGAWFTEEEYESTI